MDKAEHFTSDEQIEWPEQTHDEDNREIEDDGFVTVHGLDKKK